MEKGKQEEPKKALSLEQRVKLLEGTVHEICQKSRGRIRYGKAGFKFPQAGAKAKAGK